MKKYEKEPTDCRHDNVDWNARPTVEDDGLSYRGKCTDCGSKVIEFYLPTGEIELLES